MTPSQMAALGVAALVALVYAWPMIKELTPAVFFKHVLAVVAAVALVVAFIPQKTVIAPVERGKIATILQSASKQDRARVRAYYAAMGDVIHRDTGVITTVGRWRQANANALDLAFKGTDLPGKYPGLDAAIEEVLIKAIGKDDVAMTADKKAALAAALGEVADAAR